jgi:hypothetical protein
MTCLIRSYKMRSFSCVFLKFRYAYVVDITNVIKSLRMIDVL